MQHLQAPLAGAVLARIDRGVERLDRWVPYTTHDVLEYAPITARYVGGGMTIAALCAAAIEFSDNTAANLLLRSARYDEAARDGANDGGAHPWRCAFIEQPRTAARMAPGDANRRRSAARRFPAPWLSGDKTGTGDRGTTNEVAATWPPHRAPIVIAAYFTGSSRSDDARSNVLAQVGRIVASAFA